MSVAPPKGADPGRRPGRPRDARTDEAIIAATLRLSADVGLVGLSVEAVAAEAGCSKATIYRRWASKEELVAHALSVGQAVIDDVDTGTLVGDLEHHFAELIDRLTRGRADVIPDLLQAEDDNSSIRRSLADYNARREEPVRLIIARAIERGELPSDTEPNLVLDQVFGPVLYRHLFSDRPLNNRFLHRLLADVVELAGD